MESRAESRETDEVSRPDPSLPLRLVENEGKRGGGRVAVALDVVEHLLVRQAEPKDALNSAAARINALRQRSRIRGRGESSSFFREVCSSSNRPALDTDLRPSRKTHKSVSTADICSTSCLAIRNNPF